MKLLRCFYYFQIESGVSAHYELEYLLLEGHCYDTATGMPPRGLQFTLGTTNNPIMFDTIVMANLVGISDVFEKVFEDFEIFM
jgi:hypothetical protein